MSKVHADEESGSIRLLKNPHAINGDSTWLLHKINMQSGIIEIMNNDFKRKLFN